MLVSDVIWLEGLFSLLEGGEREDRRLKVPFIRDVTESPATPNMAIEIDVCV